MPVSKMECVTVLKNQETRVNIGKVTEIKRENRSFLSRLCILSDKRNLLIGILLVMTLISFVTQLPLHLQFQRHEEQLKIQGQKLKDLILAEEMFIGREGESAKSRSERTAATAVPHFYLEGWTMYDELTEATDEIGLFRWKRPDHRSFNRYNDFFHVESLNGYLTKVRIIKPGMYFIFAKVTANGRQTHDSDIRPPVGIQLKKNNEVLEQAWTTQDERGRLYGALDFGHTPERDKYPLDTVTVIGLHYLETNDEIFIQRPPESIYNIPDRFLSNEINQQFGAFLIEGCLNC